MAQAYRNSAEIPGVWFLEENQILELDSKIESHFSDLKSMRSADITEEVKNERKMLRERGMSEDGIKTELAEFKKKRIGRYPHSEELKCVTIKSGNKDVTVCRSFAEAIARPEILKTNASGFTVELKAGKNSSKFSLEEGVYGNIISVKVEPDSESTAAFLVEIERWAETNRVDRFLQWWNRNWIFSFGLGFVFFMIIGPILDSKDVSYDGVIAAHTEARKLIDEGVSDSNRDKAITALLKLAVDIRPTVTRRFSEWWLFAVGISAIGIIVIGLMPPQSILGIGRGKNTLYWRKQWFKFWTRTFPFTVVGGIAMKVLIHLISTNLVSK